MRLIDEKGEQVGVVRTDRALTMAEEAGLDLVEISPTAKPPVCRIMNFGKYQFEQSKRKAAQKKKQRLVHLKEVKFRPGTDVGDYQVKLRKIATFLDRGDKVKVSLRFRGREMQHRELGLELLGRVKRDLGNIVVEQEPRLEGRQMTMVVMKAKGEGNKTKREDHAEIKD
ncbi:bacterial protein translation initiation factor 3 [Coxiella burnetii CbuK_Q154]|uniref:Translation initiation factor IF-3 n=1 Tax=Coxiella burnetii (strain Dugway 5J108-111) TaxID=434922 RepID=A9KGC0_COXBN|nr:translation initiation factor IF-3 [Coxiella burnetii]NP_820315.1 protein translation initiation factor 3 [Coxiella burnetii RSA 493]ABS76666.1 bacterial protein translation initiation factor 3 (IF-3) [Coxiella burnetii Dugway 5J108-111]ABX77836.1 translation initiation factor IF-3 [Coxiella burnetii RSA 331]ACJ18084.1 bacterial protein translation initiation factor 3 [Coxiella burnetii CbuG_Q212]ACJ20380.1 bacterial protein translation initiation factor 3 [Coxiella burnetii CbuK_Q154]EAX3